MTINEVSDNKTHTYAHSWDEGSGHSYTHTHNDKHVHRHDDKAGGDNGVPVRDRLVGLACLMDGWLRPEITWRIYVCLLGLAAVKTFMRPESIRRR